MGNYRFLIVNIFICLCLSSCQQDGKRRWPRGTYEKGIELVRTYAHIILPDSLFQYFPSKAELNNSYMLTNQGESIFQSFPKVKITERNPLPWMYYETYFIKVNNEYHSVVDRFQSMALDVLNGSNMVYTYNQLCNAIYGIGNDSIDYHAKPFFILQNGPTNTPGTTVLLNNNYEDIKGDDFRVSSLNKNYPTELTHGYANGITYYDTLQEICFWIVVW